MKKIKKFVCFALACTAILSGSIIVGAQVEKIDGVDVAFVSSFGRVSYGGKPHTAFKNFKEALDALTDGGRIVLQGNSTLETLTFASDLEIVGIGTKASGNRLSFTSDKISLAHDLSLSNVCVEMPENGVIVTNGNDLVTDGGFDSYSKEIYSANSANTIIYPAPISVAAGSFSDDSEIRLLSGKYKTVSAGSGNGSLSIIADSITADSIIIGADSTSFEIDGDLVYDLSGVSVESVSASKGKVNGNLILKTDSKSVIQIFDLSELPEVSGKSVLVTDNSSKTEKGNFDLHIKLALGEVYPVSENGVFKGLRFSDKNGLSTKKILVSGEEIIAEDGLFVLADGVYEISPVPSIELFLNASSNYVNGYTDGTFLPQNNMTRAEAVTTLARLIADENSFKTMISSDYSDVPSDAWYTSYIGLFEKLGYLDTIASDGTILPNEKITRGEFCELLYKIRPLLSPKLFGTKKFSDVSSGYKYRDAIEFAGFAGIVGGYEDGTFRPDNLITRAEVVTMINRMIGRIPSDSDITVFADTNGHWAKGQINAAANPAQKDGVIMWTQSSTNKFDEYMQYRGNLSNTAYKLNVEKKLNVAFIGGSITAGSGAPSGMFETHSWRGRTMQYFKEAFPDCTINQVNAAIGDSYTKYAVYRMDNDLLKYNFDLIFIEYAINDSPWYSAKQDSETVIYFETLLRRIYDHNPKADVVIVYTIDDKIDRTPDYFPTASAQEAIAKHYDVPSVNFGRALADHIAEGGYEWADYFADYVHPNADGHLYYGAVLSEYLTEALMASENTLALKDKVLPEKHTKKALWYDLTMLEAEDIDLSLSKNWALSKDRTKIYPTDANNELVIKTYGSDICIASPRDDLMYYSVDGGAEQYMKMNRKPQTLFENLSDGEHILRIRSQDITKLSIQRVMYNGKAPETEKSSSAKSAGNILILGDSYSTFEGAIPKGFASWYLTEYSEKDKDCTDVTSITETWWYKFSKETGSKIALNSSYSGSTICNTGYGGGDSTGSSFITRADNLISEGFFDINSIDTILIFGATNDHWAGSPLGQMKYSDWTKEDLKAFRPALCYLLSRLTENAGGARIIYIINTGFSAEIENSIVTACNRYGVETLKLSDFSKTDGHPNIAGMESIKNQLIAYLEK